MKVRMEISPTLTLSILCLVLVINAQSPDCPLGFTAHGEKCYHVSETEATWAGAMGYCRTMNSVLARVDNYDLQAFIQKIISSKYSENNVTVNTGNDYVYHYVHDLGVDVTGHSAISFDVMACNDAHVALSKDKGIDTRNTYEIVIGGWADSASVIRDCKQCHNYDVENHNHHPVSCTKFNSFWISWAHSVIRVGTGKIVGKEIFMQWNDLGPHDVNYVAVATGWGATGKWVFHTANYFPGLFWIGASDMAVEGEWLWLPGTTKTDYVNWAPGEPDNYNNQDHCDVIDAHRNYQWADDNCEEMRNFICEYTPPQDKDGVVIG